MADLELKVLRKKYGFTQEEFADKIGITRELYGQMERGVKAVSKASKILIEKFQKDNNVPNNENNIVNESENSYTALRRYQKNAGTRQEVPVYGGFSTLGNITVYDDEGLKNEVIATLPPSIFPNCDYAEKAKGDSMYPLIMNQALLVGKTCNAKGISYGEKYIIKTRDGLDTVKFIHPVKDDNNKKVDGKLLLVAHNKSIPPQEIEIDEITFACRVHWIVNPT